jgi:hypothetical protein
VIRHLESRAAMRSALPEADKRRVDRAWDLVEYLESKQLISTLFDPSEDAPAQMARAIYDWLKKEYLLGRAKERRS